MDGRPRQNPAYRPAQHADVAQLAEHYVANVKAAGSTPVVRSKNTREWLELVDAPGSDPGGPEGPWEFDSPPAHSGGFA
jgi:hypothetical protein